MTDPYYIDLEGFSLERLRRIFETQEVLPARQVLKEDIAGRFGVLAAHGIQSLGDVVAALKTKARIEAFAEQSGLPRDYLVILGREARSYLPKLVYLRDILGVDPEHVEALSAVGIRHSKHLFERGRTAADREALSEETGVPPEDLLELVKLSDLARVRGMGPAFVRLFYEGGADTIETLARWNPEALWEALHNLNRERGITSVVPPLKDLVQYVEMAQDLPKMIEYE
jgi:hypothetical protein